MKKKRVKKNGNFSLKQEYYQSFKYIKESKNFIYAAILIFFIFVAIGFFFQDIINLMFKNFLGINLQDQMLELIKRLLESTKDMSQKELIGYIFFNNVQSSFYAVFFGILFGIMPLFSSITNGYLLGFVALISVKAQGFLVLWKVLPHGIFELPALFISLGLGFKLGTYFFIKKKKSFFLCILNSLKIFLLIILPLLIIAAIIEGTLILFLS